MRTVFIYGLSDPTTGLIRYVGKSVAPKERLATHIREARAGSVVHCKRWIAGVLNRGMRPTLSILEEVDSHSANDSERFWIASFRLGGADLTNLTPGGDGQPAGYRRSPEAVARGAEKLKGQKRSAEQRARMKEAFSKPELRKRRSEITSARMADPVQRFIVQSGRTGVPMSEDAKRKISASWTMDRKALHAAEKSALPMDERWRAQLRNALSARWAKHRKSQNAC